MIEFDEIIKHPAVLVLLEDLDYQIELLNENDRKKRSLVFSILTGSRIDLLHTIDLFIEMVTTSEIPKNLQEVVRLRLVEIHSNTESWGVREDLSIMIAALFPVQPSEIN